MNTKREKVELILTEILSSYTLNARSSKDGCCLYAVDLDNEGNPVTDCLRCGVGRFIDPELAPTWVWELQADVDTLSERLLYENNALLDDILYPHVRGLSINVWKSVQNLHDFSELWDYKGPHYDGIRFANRILREHG